MPVIIDPASRIEEAVELFERRLGRDFLAMVATITDRSKLREVAVLIEAGRFEELLRVVTEEAAAFAASAARAFSGSATQTSAFLSSRLDVRLTFDMTNERAVQAMREATIRITQGITNAQREAVQDALIEGVRVGANPIEQARTFRNVIGLNKPQARAVRNYEEILRVEPSEALSRKLRDRRFDPTIRSAVRNKRPLTEDEIARMVKRYRERTIKHRAEVIARTEALRAAHEGNEEAYMQAVESGAFDENEVVRRWITARDERVRGSHRTMHFQQRTAAQLAAGELFVSGNGNHLRFPGDSRAAASETILCRCSLTTRIETQAESTALAA